MNARFLLAILLAVTSIVIFVGYRLVSDYPSIDVGSTLDSTRRLQAMRIASKIHEGMTFGEITKIIPLRTNQIGEVRFRRVIFEVPIASNYTVVLQFESLLEGTNRSEEMQLEKLLLNRTPKLLENMNGKWTTISNERPVNL